jgi:hypothetical protein
MGLLTFMALLKLWQFSGSTPMTRTSGRMVLTARATPAQDALMTHFKTSS